MVHKDVNHQKINRREFLKKTKSVLLASGTISYSLQNVYGNTSKIRDVRSKEFGSVSFEGPREVEVSTYQTFNIVFKAGKEGVKPNGGIRIAARHMANVWSLMQNKEPESEGFITAETSGKASVRLSVNCGNLENPLFTLYHPWQNVVEVIVGEPGLKAGQTITVSYGDSVWGSPGFLTQPFIESHFAFKLFVDSSGNGRFLPLNEDAAIEVIAAKPNNLTTIAPSNAIIGCPCWFVIRAEDSFGNPATNYKGTVKISSSDSAGTNLPAYYTFKAEDKGVHRFENIVFNTPGYQWINVSDGAWQTQSNPVQVTNAEPENLLLWGDIHGHTLNSDGRGTIEQYYKFAKRFAALDFCAVSEHAFEMLDDMWAESKAVTNKFNQPGKFVTFNAYEWSGIFEAGGDHNVYWLDDDPPLYRSVSYYNPDNLQMYHGPVPKIEHITELYNVLEKKHLRNKNVFCIPHYGGRRANPEWHNPNVERLVEVFSEHRRSNKWASEFLQKGYKLGIMASGDGHYGKPGYGYLKKKSNNTQFTKEIGMGLIAVLAAEHTRRAIFEALYNRHCYATSGDRIVLDFRADGHIMGSEYSTSKSPEISVKAVGTDLITKVEINKNNKIIKVMEPNQRIFFINWIDDDFDKKSGCFYNVRLLQANNEEAISSPVWVN